MMDNMDYDFEAAGDETHPCEICQNMMKNAVEIGCTHTFCEKCLKGWQNEPHAR